MTMKSVQIHMEMLAGHIGSSVLALATGIFLWPPMMVVLVLILGHGLYKLYGKTLFGDDAELLMTLPFSARALTAGKLIAFLIWCSILWLISMGLAVGLMLPNHFVDLAEYLSGSMDAQQIAGMEPWQVGISCGIDMITPFIYAAILCLLTMTVELALGHVVTGKRKQAMMLLAMLVSVIIFGAALAGITFLSKWQLLLGKSGFWIGIAVDLAVIVVNVLLYKKSVKLLEYSYDLT
ncbi:hypothetical protein AALA24_09115 [Anaerovoracaceae bacterium 42-11]|nr:hypothetical protein [Emergencia sp.]